MPIVAVQITSFMTNMIKSRKASNLTSLGLAVIKNSSLLKFKSTMDNCCAGYEEINIQSDSLSIYTPQ